MIAKKQSKPTQVQALKLMAIITPKMSFTQLAELVKRMKAKGAIL